MNAVVEASTSSEMSEFSRTIFEAKYSWKDDDGNPIETWSDTANRVVSNVLSSLGYDSGSPELQRLHQLITERKFIPGGRYLYSAGRQIHNVNNCFLYKVQDSREGWSDLLKKTTLSLMLGGGVGVDYSAVRPYGAVIKGSGGISTGPLALMQILNEAGRGIMQGGTRRSAIWAGLAWDHGDCEKFIKMKDWSEEVKALKEKDFNFPATMDMTNISVLLDDTFFIAYRDVNHPKHELAHYIYNLAVSYMVRTGEPGFSVNIGRDAGETLRNPCCEITSYDDSDVCCLGSINLPRIESKEELAEVIDLATLFLLAGTVYSDVPHNEVYETRYKNRRIGLGLMGVHEWLLRRGEKYAPSDALSEWLEVYATSGEYANKWADKHALSHPVKTRALAPNGTIGIIGETTTSAEPIFCVAFKRRYLTGDGIWKYQYVIDPTAERLIEDGVDPDSIEDAYILDVEKRVAFQAWLQGYVDHAISSTVNIPEPITDPDDAREFGEMLMEYLPRLRGITLYPSGARGGQPLNVVQYEYAKNQLGVVFEEDDAKCSGSSCGV